MNYKVQIGYPPDIGFLWRCPCGRVRKVSGRQLNSGIRFCSPYCGKRGSDERGEVVMTVNSEVARTFLKHWDAAQRLYTKLGKTVDKAKPDKAIIPGLAAALLSARFLQFCGISCETGAAIFHVAWEMMAEAAAAKEAGEDPLN